MKQFEVFITQDAKSDLINIYHYSKLFSKNYIKKVVKNLYSIISILEIFPKSFPLVYSHNLIKIHYRKANIKNYNIFYTIKNKKVFIHKIIPNKSSNLN